MEDKVMVKAWKVDSFMCALTGYGIDLDSLEMKHSKNWKRFSWESNGVVIATYNEKKEHGFVLKSVIKPLNHMVCQKEFIFPY